MPVLRFSIDFLVNAYNDFFSNLVEKNGIYSWAKQTNGCFDIINGLKGKITAYLLCLRKRHTESGTQAYEREDLQILLCKRRVHVSTFLEF